MKERLFGILIWSIFLILFYIVIFVFFFRVFSTFNENKQYDLDHPCVKWGKEEYYDGSGTALWIATKNIGMLGLNGHKTRDVCLERK